MTPLPNLLDDHASAGSSPSPMAKWHALVATQTMTGLEEILAEEAVFTSPAMNTPQAGKALVLKYLDAALEVLNNGTFRYTGEWTSERSTVLEFTTVVDGLSVNGVDLIRWNEAGLIVEFKVMIRPFKALSHVMALMGERLRAG